MGATICYCDIVDDLRNGTIPITPLLQPGQTIRTLPHGAHNVTGGMVQISNLGGGNVTKVTGIIPNGNYTGFYYIPNAQLFNINYHSILFELCEAGQKHLSHSALDYAWANKQLVSPAGNVNAHYLESHRVYTGLPLSQFGETFISNRLINGIYR